MRSTAHPDITLHLGARGRGFRGRIANGVTVAGTAASQPIEERGIALVGADGMWSTPAPAARRRAAAALCRSHRLARAGAGGRCRAEAARAGGQSLARPRRACRPLSGQGRAPHQCRRDPARRLERPGWNARGRAREIARPVWRRQHGRQPCANLLAAPRRWQKWALYDRPPLRHWGKGPVTLLGDAAHPMLPYLAQGAAMAIEDAAVLAAASAARPTTSPRAMRRYERERRRRTARAQRAARRNGGVYHMGGAAGVPAHARARAMGGQRLIRRYDWLYGWKPA